MGKNLKGRELGKGLTQRKSDGLYQGRITMNGRTEYVYDKTLSTCKKKMEELRKKMLKEEKNQRPNILFDEWFEEWFQVYKRPTLKTETSAIHYYRKVKNTFVTELGKKKLSDITQIDLQIASNELVTRYAPDSIREALCVVKEIFDIAVVNQIVTVNPCVLVKVKNTHSRTERRVMSVEEERLFLENAQTDFFYEVYHFLLLTGLRIGELAALRWEDIDFVAKEIHISRSLSICYDNGRKIEEISSPKTENSYRVIPFFSGVEDVLKTWFGKQKRCREKMGDRWRCPEKFGDLVFTTTVGSPVTRYILAPKINKLVKEINLKEVTIASNERREPKAFANLHPHAFRHTFATRCMEKDLNPIFVQRIMGHANYSTTLSYTHLLGKTRDQEVKKAGNLLD